MKYLTIAEQLLHTTLRLDTIGNDGKGASGTSFFVSYEKNGINHLFLVTNKHVIKDTKQISFNFLKSKNNDLVIPRIIETSIFKDMEKEWIGHPIKEIDVAILPVSNIINSLNQKGKNPFFRSIDMKLFVTPAQISELSPLEDVLFIGYPAALRDDVNLTPISRKGMTGTPISIDFNGNPVFLISASVFGGSSGSPVFIFNEGSYSTPAGLIVGGRLLFLGILAESYYSQKSIPNTQSIDIQYIDSGVVYKSHTIVETIEKYLKDNNL